MPELLPTCYNAVAALVVNKTAGSDTQAVWNPMGTPNPTSILAGQDISWLGTNQFTAHRVAIGPHTLLCAAHWMVELAQETGTFYQPDGTPVPYTARVQGPDLLAALVRLAVEVR